MTAPDAALAAVARALSATPMAWESKGGERVKAI